MPYFGGSFAPPLPASKLAAYEALATALPLGPARDGMLSLVAMKKKFDETGPSGRAPTIHPATRTPIVTPLEEAEVRRIWDHVPWPAECDMLGKVFDALDPVTQRDVRNAAFHLLWFARELTLDREPITNDKLG